MPPRRSISPARLWRPGLSVVIAVAGFATAALVGIAIAKSFTLRVEKNAKVTNTHGVTKNENIAVTAHDFAVYTLTGDTKKHPECTKANGCFKFWPPVKVSSASKLSKAPGISGKLGVWHRNGFDQVTLGGHPLYTFAFDKGNGAATGEGIDSFGGIWHVVKGSAPKVSGASSPSPPSGTTSTNPYSSTSPASYSSTSSASDTMTSTTSNTWG